MGLLHAGAQQGQRPALEGPPRTRPHQADLWRGLRMNELAVVSTDHCPFCMKDQKELGLGNFAAIPNGIGGVEHRMELIYQGVVAGELSLERWVETCCTTPARMFGMYPKKGIITPGADADVVVWDPNKQTKIGINDKHHMNMDHSAYEGYVIDGKVDTVMSRGTVVVENDTFLGRAGHGQYIKRGLSQYLVDPHPLSSPRQRRRASTPKGTPMKRIFPLDRRSGRRVHLRPQRQRLRPRHGEVQATVDLATVRGMDRRRRRRQGPPSPRGGPRTCRGAPNHVPHPRTDRPNRKEIATILTKEHGIGPLPTPSARSPAASRTWSSPAASRTC